MEVVVYIPDESVELLGENPQEVVQAEVDRELLRLWHVRRSQPKPPGEKRPVGRPPVDKRLRELIEEGEGVFVALRRHAGEEYARVYGEFEEQFKGLVRTGNKIALEDFLGRKDWLRRRG